MKVVHLIPNHSRYSGPQWEIYAKDELRGPGLHMTPIEDFGNTIYGDHLDATFKMIAAGWKLLEIERVPQFWFWRPYRITRMIFYKA